MESINDIIQLKRTFIGRKEELHSMEHMLNLDKENWRMLHFHAPTGMGKTTLLKQFEHTHNNLPVLYIDGHRGMKTEHCVLSALQDQLIRNHLFTEKSPTSHLQILNELKCIANKHPVIVILLDGMDQYTAETMSWLKEDFLKSLPINTRVYSAGRLPLQGWQNECGWESIVRNVQLNPLNKVEWSAYAAKFGIEAPRLLYQIGIVTQGIPLAVTMTCQRIMENGNQELLDESDQRYLMGYFDSHMLSEENLFGVSKTLLAISSLVYTFDQELLEFMLGEPIDTATFTKLCQSPFVEVHADGGWMIKNGIRKWARAGLKERLPDAYEKYKERAGRLLERRIVQANLNEKMLRLELAYGKLFLQENEFVHSYVYFGNQKNLNVRAANQEDLPMLADMYQKNFQMYPPNVTDDSHQEQYLTEIWEIEPNAIQIIEQDGQCLCFYVFVPLHHNMKTMLSKNPITANWINKTRIEEHDWFYWMISTYVPMDQEVIGFFLRHLFVPSLPGKRVTCLLWSKDQSESIRFVGFEPLTYANARTPNKLEFFFFRLDSRESSSEAAVTNPPSWTVRNKEAIAEWASVTKRLLIAYPHLSRDPQLLAQCNQLWQSELAYDEMTKHIVEVIQQLADLLNEGSHQEKVQAQILQFSYLKKIGTHETVADRLDLPSSTYYRQLKKLIDRIAFMLFGASPTVNGVSVGTSGTSRSREG